ncbi:HTH_48 domain-containing protein [Trichonephila clavipes]|nr:HTH_48 domain-containing protein [Trichonephila clavipes]
MDLNGDLWFSNTAILKTDAESSKKVGNENGSLCMCISKQDVTMSGMWIGSIISVDCGDVLGVFEGEISNVDGENQTISLINVSRNSVKCQVPEVTLSCKNLNLKFSFPTLSEMANQIPEEIHICHSMLLEFHKGSNATISTKKICDVCPSALDVRKCQRWFSKFRSGNFDLSNSHRSGRPTTLDNDIIKGQVEANPYQIIEEMSNLLTNLGRSSKNICNRLVKQSRCLGSA